MRFHFNHWVDKNKRLVTPYVGSTEGKTHLYIAGSTVDQHSVFQGQLGGTCQSVKCL